DFQTPPKAAPTYTVLPVASLGSIAIAVIRPETSPLSETVAAVASGSGPSSFHALLPVGWNPIRPGDTAVRGARPGANSTLRRWLRARRRCAAAGWRSGERRPCRNHA